MSLRSFACPAGLLASLACLSGFAFAQGLPEREFGEPYGGIPFGTRAVGMGGAYTAVSDDLAGTFYNPGGLIQMRESALGIQTGSPYFGRTTSFSDVASQFSSGEVLPWTGGIAFITTAFRPWAAGVSVTRNFHSESLFPWQDEYYTGTFVMPINKTRTGGMGINVRYVHSSLFWTNPDATQPDQQLQDPVTGYAADIGFFYRIPMPLRDRRREIAIGVMARNVVGSSRVGNTETTLPAQALLGWAYTFDDIVPRERSVIAFNLDQSLRASSAATSAQLRVGLEQSFFSDVAALRFGYATPMPAYDPIYGTSAKGPTGGVAYQGRPAWSAGLSVSMFHMTADLAVTVPAETRVVIKNAAVPENPYINVEDATGYRYVLPVDATRFYAQITYRFGSTLTAPFARIAVEPLVFAPKKGEVAVFTTDWRDERGIESWTIEIKNSARVPVRTFAGKGAPPSRLVWDGLDDRFNLTPDDDHTYTLTIKNRDGLETVTPPQVIRIFTPGDEQAGKGGDPTFIYKILDEQRKKEEAERAAVKPLIQGQLEEQKRPLGEGGGSATGAESVPADEAPPPSAPGVPALPALPMPGATLAAGSAPAATATGTGAGLALRGLEPGQIVRLQIPPAPGSDQVVLEYQSQQYLLKAVAREVRSLTEQAFAAVGPAAASFMVQARFGNHLLVVESPAGVVRDLRSGRLDEDQWVRASRMTLDGRAVQPELE